MRIHSEMVHRATEGVHLVVSENWVGVPARPGQLTKIRLSESA